MFVTLASHRVTRASWHVQRELTRGALRFHAGAKLASAAHSESYLSGTQAEAGLQLRQASQPILPLGVLDSAAFGGGTQLCVAGLGPSRTALLEAAELAASRRPLGIPRKGAQRL